MSPDAEAKIDETPVVVPVVPPDDESFLAALRTTYTQKPDDVSVMASLKALSAQAVGLYELPAKLIKAIAKTAETMSEPIDGATFVQLNELIIRREYADILTAVNCRGAAKYINNTCRNQLLDRVRTCLVPALVEFHQSLVEFRDEIARNFSGDAAIGLLLSMNRADSNPLTAWSNLLAVPPSTEPILNASEKLVAAVNSTLCGWGLAAARVMAYDAIEIGKALSHPELPKFAGFLNREQMLKGLGIEVTQADIARERNLAEYAVLAMSLNRGLPSDQEKAVIGTLLTIGRDLKLEDLAA